MTVANLPKPEPGFKLQPEALRRELTAPKSMFSMRLSKHCSLPVGLDIEHTTHMSTVLSTSYPEWDSNPQQKDFKSSTSANWVIGA